MKKKIVIVGAGPAGLTAAYKILKAKANDYSVVILEQDKQVGGISKSVTFGNYTVDTGIHRYFTKNDEVNKIWKTLLPIQNKQSYDQIILDKNLKNPHKSGSNPEKDEKSLLVKDRLTRIYYGKKFYDYPVTINMETLKNLGFKEIVCCGFSYLKSVFIKRKETSLENFYINKFGKRLYQHFFESYTEKVWGIHPSKLSADWGAQRTKGVSITSVLMDVVKTKLKIKNSKNTVVSLTDTFFYPKLGSLQMWDAMKEEIIKMGGKIITNALVSKINIKDGVVTSVEYQKNNTKKEIKVDKFISSMAIKDLVEMISGNITIPKEVYQAATNLPYREFMSVCMVLKKIKWQNDKATKNVLNIPPDSWDYIQDPDLTLGRIQIFNNWSPYLFKNKKEFEKHILVGLEYFCSENDKYWNMSDDDFIDFATKEIIKLGLISGKDDCIKATRIKIKKAYPAYFGSYDKIEEIKQFLNSIDNLYCIGRNGQHRYNNMDHAMLTGIEVANTIIKNLKNKDNIWNVNVDKEYHEEKNSK